MLFKAEHVKQWLKDLEAVEKAERDGSTGVQGLGTQWKAFARLVKIIWETGNILRQMMWVIVVLLTKGGGNFRGIRLLKPFWKVLEIIMDN